MRSDTIAGSGATAAGRPPTGGYNGKKRLISREIRRFTFTLRRKSDIEKHFFHFLDQIGEEYVVIVRLHYLIASKVDLSAYQGRVFNFSSLDDINQLYVISDILVTDYSSVFFDYANNHPSICKYHK